MVIGMANLIKRRTDTENHCLKGAAVFSISHANKKQILFERYITSITIVEKLEYRYIKTFVAQIVDFL